MRIETDSQHYTDIAEAIRDMNGTENAYYPEEMASAILAIPQETYNVFAPIIYSLEEREVGVWTDGKPLYQRVFEFTNALTIPSSTWTLTNIDSTNIEKIVYCAGIHSDGTCYAFIGADPTQSAHSKVGIWSTRNSNITLKGLILQYTKISDVAGSGSWGTDEVPMVHYDGTERIIGTWFGQTLYQKTIYQNNIAMGYSSTATPPVQTQVAHGVSNIGEIVYLQMCCPVLGIVAKETLFNSGTVMADFRVNNTYIQAVAGNNYFGASSDRYWYFTIQYTKSSS